MTKCHKDQVLPNLYPRVTFQKSYAASPRSPWCPGPFKTTSSGRSEASGWGSGSVFGKKIESGSVFGKKVGIRSVFLGSGRFRTRLFQKRIWIRLSEYPEAKALWTWVLHWKKNVTGEFSEMESDFRRRSDPTFFFKYGSVNPDN